MIDMSFAFDCPDTEESSYAVHICNVVSPALYWRK